MLVGLLSVTVAVATLTSLAGCGGGDAYPWSSEPIDTLATGTPASFPRHLEHWTLEASWSDVPRAFANGGTWTTTVGPNQDAFPVSMNGCGDQRFLVRWRAVSDGVNVQAGQVDIEGAAGKTVSGHAGWMDLDGCSAPAFRLAGDLPDGSTLTDVTVQVQQYTPAP